MQRIWHYIRQTNPPQTLGLRKFSTESYALEYFAPTVHINIHGNRSLVFITRRARFVIQVTSNEVIVVRKIVNSLLFEIRVVCDRVQCIRNSRTMHACIKNPAGLAAKLKEFIHKARKYLSAVRRNDYSDDDDTDDDNTDDDANGTCGKCNRRIINQVHVPRFSCTVYLQKLDEQA